MRKILDTVNFYNKNFVYKRLLGVFAGTISYVWSLHWSGPVQHCVWRSIRRCHIILCGGYRWHLNRCYLGLPHGSCHPVYPPSEGNRAHIHLCYGLPCLLECWNLPHVWDFSVSTSFDYLSTLEYMCLWLKFIDVFCWELMKVRRWEQNYQTCLTPVELMWQILQNKW